LTKMEKFVCAFCNVDLGVVHNASVDATVLGGEILRRAMMTPIGRRLLSPGRVLVVHKEGSTRVPAIILGQGLNTSFNVVKLALSNDGSVPSWPIVKLLI
jgi:antiviral helicase SKI2